MLKSGAPPTTTLGRDAVAAHEQAPTVLNGWTARDLNHMSRALTQTQGDVSTLKEDVGELKRDVGGIRSTLEDMQSDEMRELRDRNRELEGRPRAWFFGLLVPVAVVVLAELLQHVHVI
jgi:hypothetical protein